jgi:hypothetical protein
MSSLLRVVSQKKDGLTKFLKPESPAYNDSVLGEVVLFPFTVTKGVLDITYDGNNFEADMVTSTGNAPSAETDLACQITSGPIVIRALGDKFKDYVRAWRDGTIDAGSPIEIYQAPQMIRVQQADVEHINANSSNSYRVSTTVPSNDSYLAGTSTNSYLSTYIFKTPLTFTIVESSVTTYITFRTMMDQE